MFSRKFIWKVNFSDQRQLNRSFDFYVTYSCKTISTNWTNELDTFLRIKYFRNTILVELSWNVVDVIIPFYQTNLQSIPTRANCSTNWDGLYFQLRWNQTIKTVKKEKRMYFPMEISILSTLHSFHFHRYRIKIDELKFS